MVKSWVTRFLVAATIWVLKHAIRRVIPSQKVGIMPGFHVPDGLDDVKIKIQEQLPVRCPQSLTGHIGSSWIIWFMWILKSNGVLSAFVRRELYPARMFQLYAESAWQVRGATCNPLMASPVRCWLGSRESHGDFMFMVSISCPQVGLQCLDN